MLNPPRVSRTSWSSIIVVVAAIGVARVGFAAEFELTLLDGRLLRGELRAVQPRVSIEVEGKPRDFSWDDLLSLRPIHNAATTQFASSSAAPATSVSAISPASGALVFELCDDSRFTGLIVASTGENFSVRPPGLSAGRLEITMLRDVRAPDITPSAAALLETSIEEGDEATDLAVVSRESKNVLLRGAVRRITEKDVLFTWNGRDVSLPWPRVAGVRFARSSTRRAPVAITTMDGAVFAGRIRDGGPESATLVSSAFDRLEIPWSRIKRVDSHTDRVIPLSLIKPAGYAFEAFFDKQWDYGVDRSLFGRPIRLGGRTYERGIVMHSHGELSYAVDAGFSRFAATAGIVDEMDGRGCVDMRLLGDGQLIWEAKGVRGGEPGRPVVADIAGVQVLTLVVDFGDDLDLSDHAVWAFARLIR